MEFSGVIENGKPRIFNMSAYRAALQKSDGGRITITIGGRKRTDRQNRYYWPVVLGTISSETGQPVDDLHAIFKVKFLGYIEKEFKGYKVFLPRSTTTLSTTEFNVYVEQICAFAAQDLGLYIPQPGE